MLTAVKLANKRTRKVMRRRTLRNGRRRNAASLDLGRHRARLRMNAEALAKLREQEESKREESRAAVKAAVAGKRGGFLDGVKSSLFKMMPRRTGE
jgi:hypothetical protein